MAFEKPIPQWFAAGAEPPEALRKSGFTAGYKPPADYFNWFWHLVSEALAELQEKSLSGVDLSALTGVLPVENGGTGKTNLNDVKVGSAEWAAWATHMGLTECSNKDFNTLRTPGYYFGYTNMTNAAFNEISVLEVIPYSSDWVLQRQTRLTDGKTYCRYFSSGSTWSAWYTILTTLHKPTPANISEGTFSGYVAASPSGQHYGTSLLRNTKLVNADTTPTVDGEIFWTYK